MSRNALCASAHHCPYVSTANGTHFQPSAAHLPSLALCLASAAFDTRTAETDGRVPLGCGGWLGPLALPEGFDLRREGAEDGATWEKRHVKCIVLRPILHEISHDFFLCWTA